MPLSSSSVAPSILMEYGFMHTFAYCCLSRKRWLALCTLCASLIRESTKGSFWFDAVIRFMIKIKDTDKKKGICSRFNTLLTEIAGGRLPLKLLLEATIKL